ncbi:undecaprenyldiphospho-muramoylpentapeptide beta-N-acetylglucosaminyltransferase [Spiribacter pallidus]|uniref:UDP-N-acetylglucosamine--N-acetylmuramyl-(pentapeptide) pyrophosphoryl-undecaprenol N-acetylglucosamine transferase n=1 Tax=Spiribacter pallidus TaxID=1987936 RepID=A0ABV3TBB3_9GAMM
MSGQTVFIAAGGTGGHVFPALAVAQALTRRGVEVVWLGTAHGLEARIVPEAGLTFARLPVRGLRGNGPVGWLKAPLSILRAMVMTMGLIRRHGTGVMLGMGGYVTGPAGVAAWLCRCPLVIHEQNAISGMTNRWLARIARRVLTGLGATFEGKPGEFVGNPVRPDIAALDPPGERYPQHPQPPCVLVLGGSLGALTLNRVVPAALARLPEAQRPVVMHQAGERTIDDARQAYDQAGVEADLRVFIDDVATVYERADLVICRAGALTVSELAAAGLAAILVPFPHAVDDHQTANGQWLVDAGAAEMIANHQLTPEALAQRLSVLLPDREALTRRAEAARALGRPRAAEQVADICLEVAA